MEKILVKIRDEAFVRIDLNEDNTKLEVAECVDGFFETVLTKLEVEELIKKLTALHNEMI